MVDQLHGPEGQKDPQQFAFNLGALISDSQIDGEEVVSDILTLLENMDRVNISQESHNRFERIAGHMHGRPVDREGSTFAGLIGTITGVLLERNNDDVDVPADIGAETASQVAAAVILESFISGVTSNGFSRPYVRQLVKHEIVGRKQEIQYKSSYAAVNGVRFLDGVIDELGMDGWDVRVARIVSSLRSIRRFGGDIFAR